MNFSNIQTKLAAGFHWLALGAFICSMVYVSTATAADQVQRYPLENSNFPIAAAVEVSGGALIFESGKVPGPKDAKAEKYSAAYWGNTEEQSLDVLQQIEASLKSKGLGMGDVIKMTVFLVGDQAKGGQMDFGGMMKAYTQFFGTAAQPNLPARSAVQVAGLAVPGMLVEIEVIAYRSKK
ncbi:RidA family protein [Simiduia curdlanivorans]|uniref:RidA family protein n=1 Tax=Simiduia curdlanivorans TaxID=1492769 RepID=A0ABV8V1W6_9GAMM|nr:RidA family protein [Simiduia curdlanivorans]MDN3640080.1 RidA family protein [Simiduia curdlanivorans]